MEEAMSKLLMPKEAAELLRASRSKLLALERDGELVPVWIGGRRLYDAADVQAFIERSKGRPSPWPRRAGDPRAHEGEHTKRKETR
jgi:excisionase family DNA binding protein